MREKENVDIVFCMLQLFTKTMSAEEVDSQNREVVCYRTMRARKSSSSSKSRKCSSFVNTSNNAGSNGN